MVATRERWRDTWLGFVYTAVSDEKFVKNTKDLLSHPMVQIIVTVCASIALACTAFWVTTMLHGSGNTRFIAGGVASGVPSLFLVGGRVRRWRTSKAAVKSQPDGGTIGSSGP